MMFPLMLPMLIGAGLGAMKSKDPLKGALLGAGMGAVGGTAAPAMGGLLGGAGAAAPGVAGAAASGAAPSMATAMPAFDPISGGFVNAGNLQSGMGGLMNNIKPIAQAVGTANQLGLLGGQDQPITPSPTMQSPGGGSQVLGQLAQTPDAVEQGRQLRKQRRGLV